MVNHKDPRVIRTQHLIQDSFRELLKIKSFDAITIKDITQKATINRATFYAHFEDKFALLDEITTLSFEDMLQDELLVTQKFTKDVCKQLLETTYKYIIKFYRTCKYDSKSISGQVDGKIRQLLYSTIESILKNTDLPINHEIHANMISAALYNAAYYWYDSKKGDDISGLSDIVVRFIMNGLEINH